MLRPLSARDASTCLRCNLRLVLRQIHQRRNQSSDQSPHLTLDSTVQAPTPEQKSIQNEQSGLLSIVRTHGNHGRIRGRKGGQRRVESSEPLSIDSLGRSSDVIVLRDLHEPQPAKKSLLDYQNMQEEGTLEPKPRALTSRDIQEMAGGRAIRPALAEVFESIDALRPEEGVYIVTRSEYDAKFTAIAKAYNMTQLRGYVYQYTRPERKRGTALKSSKRNSTAVRQNNVDSTEISSSGEELQTLTRTAWHPGDTPIEKRLPVHLSTVHTARKMNNKEYVIDFILRDIWSLGIEEEEAALGELEFILSPMQFGLLLTKNSETLRPLLDSSKYYKNSRFQLHQADRVIRIIGPKAEAEAIAHVLAEAYAPARSADMDLKSFHTAMHSYPTGFKLHDVLTLQRLNNIMELTRTYISYDSDARRLRIASFVDTAINDAHRLIVALLPMDMRRKVIDLYDMRSTDEYRLEPISTMKHLPSRHKHRLLGRWVTISTKIPSPDEQFPTQPNQGAEILDSGGASDATTVPLYSPIVAKALDLMESHFEKQAVSPSPKYSSWPSQDEYGSWNARIGQSLHDVQVATSYPGASALHPDVSKEHTRHRESTFAPYLPGLVGLLACGRPPAYKGVNPIPREGTQLIAHLVPSPFEGLGCLASTALPRIQLRFNIHDSDPTHDLEDFEHSIMPTPLPNGKWIAFSHMRLNIATDVVSMHLPTQPADIILERERVLISKYVTRDARIRSFVKAVQTSMASDTVLRAPPALKINVPAHVVVTQLPNNKSLKTRKPERSNPGHGPTVPTKYLFAGFEYREWNSFAHSSVEPHCNVMAETFEAGVAGGRRVEVTVRPKYKLFNNVQDRAMLRKLIGASVKVLKILGTPSIGNLDSPTTTIPKAKEEETFEPSKLKPRKENDARGKPASKEKKKTSATTAEMAQGSNIADLEKLRPEEVASDEKQLELELELDTDQRPRIEEAALGEPPRLQNSTPDSADEQIESGIKPASRADNEALENAISKSEIEVQALDVLVPAERVVEPVTQEIPSTSEPAPSTSRDTASEQTIAQEVAEDKDTTSEQASAQESQEDRTEEEKAPEEEPLSVRLRRLMGGA
ncbi:hypothetical protein AUEXF2481DRAFT_136845 [Aureobasidium subglaciale EXF-2481]|uniref:Uncharacterized protein n=1 Tax=Aureobasidium subglaciale (strain EXF-2481) TaxID=1043005 RepID=A0A074ZQ70_AURSE|nr:uncharacterized protein AUEXF2481DRAFT_136845 [Aureobasidium subglaciale EXF-2481]KAI5198236.1 hypothetical protein E4T38_07609 [Aureobasidium subglaciale]KAI5217041.1 hypothetical protein E4T40_07619 [Aureobasidium subglaciale]KAI5220453.1 hypothetical protein E4T41_07534 [Aureobasidium subglaciale]KAI5258220.1 hypothetical protein E4T46_07515 [Aureobasidium subglaciale]KER00452.1 hypothetical protein AUEXF2481DRAFT_136845 [Aureobasidium subglaciale EXF-2481]